MSPHQQNRIRILLVDDHLVVRAGLRMLLDSHPGLTVVGEAGTRVEALTVASREKPDIILLDLNFSENSGLQLMAELLAEGDDARILLLTGVRDSEIHQQAVRIGAMGLVLKEKAPDELFKAIEKVYAGEVWLDRSLTARVLTKIVRNSDTNNNKTIDPKVDR